MPSTVLFFKNQPPYVECKSCGAKIQPIFCAERPFILYAMFALYCVCAFFSVQLIKPLGLWGLVGAIVLLNWSTNFVILQINKCCARGFEAVDKNVSENQFSLLYALHILLGLGGVIGFCIVGPEDGWRALLGAYILIGLIQAARYISIKRSQSRVS